MLSIFCSLLTGCAYKSIIIAPRNTGDTTVICNRSSDSLSNQNSNTILNNPISLNKLFGDESKNDGSFFIFMSNSNLFIEAEVNSQNLDTSTLKGTVYDKMRNDTLNFELKYSTNGVSQSITNKKQDSFVLNLILDEKYRNDSLKQSFYFSKTKNFEIQENILELYTGEVKYEKQEGFSYIIINDPSKFSKTLKAVCILTIVDLEAAAIRCKSKYKNECPKGYEAKIYWRMSLIYKDVYCECKH